MKKQAKEVRDGASLSRRRFLAALGAFIPVLAAALWVGQRRRGARPSAPAAPGGGEKAAAAAPGSAATVTWQLHYGPGLPLHWREPSSPASPVLPALAVARRHILAHCTDLARSNLVIHGVRALGRELPLAGDAYQVLLQHYTQETAVGSRLFLEVPVYDEGHGHAMLKTLVERQCEPELGFTHAGRSYDFHAFVDSTRQLSAYPAPGPVDDHSWTLMALARVTPPAAARWENAHGRGFDLERLYDDTSAALLADTALVRDVDLSLAELPRDCPAFSRACGGLHMLYALAAALSSGYANAARRADFATHMRTLGRRFVYDLGVIEQVEKLNEPRIGAARAWISALDQRLKFLGHSLETVGLVDQFRLYEWTREERQHTDGARKRLCAEIEASARLDFAALQHDRETYESLVSALCHAYNGLRLSPG